MIDVMDIKLKVIKAACGITALSELDLLKRLEELYIDGMKAGADALRDATIAKVSAEKDCACPGGQAQHLKDCVYVK